TAVHVAIKNSRAQSIRGKIVETGVGDRLAGGQDRQLLAAVQIGQFKLLKMVLEGLPDLPGRKILLEQRRLQQGDSGRHARQRAEHFGHALAYGGYHAQTADHYLSTLI